MLVDVGVKVTVGVAVSVGVGVGEVNRAKETSSQYVFASG